MEIGLFTQSSLRFRSNKTNPEIRGFQRQFSEGEAFVEFQMLCAPSSVRLLAFTATLVAKLLVCKTAEKLRLRWGKLKCHRICCSDIQPFFLNKRFFGCCIPWRRDRLPIPVFLGFPGGSDSKESPAVQETWAQSLGWEDPLEKGMATHSSILAWRIPWTEEPGRL